MSVVFVVEATVMADSADFVRGCIFLDVSSDPSEKLVLASSSARLQYSVLTASINLVNSE